MPSHQQVPCLCISLCFALYSVPHAVPPVSVWFQEAHHLVLRLILLCSASCHVLLWFMFLILAHLSFVPLFCSVVSLLLGLSSLSRPNPVSHATGIFLRFTIMTSNFALWPYFTKCRQKRKLMGVDKVTVTPRMSKASVTSSHVVLSSSNPPW